MWGFVSIGDEFHEMLAHRAGLIRFRKGFRSTHWVIFVVAYESILTGTQRIMPWTFAHRINRNGTVHTSPRLTTDSSPTAEVGLVSP